MKVADNIVRYPVFEGGRDGLAGWIVRYVGAVQRQNPLNTPYAEMSATIDLYPLVRAGS